MNECGQKWHVVLNDKSICDEIVHISQKYWRKSGSENAAVVNACTDLVQSWGEAFLPHRKQYPNIVEMYSVLRQVGYPFKKHDHDAHQILPQQQSHGSQFPPHGHHQRNRSDPSAEDAALAASLQASLNLETGNRDRPTAAQLPAHFAQHNPPSRAVDGYESPARLTDAGSRSRQASIRRPTDSPSARPNPHSNASPSATASPGNASNRAFNARELLESLRSAANLMRDLLAAASTVEDVRRNELATEIAVQIQTNQAKINIAVEQCMNDGEVNLCTVLIMNMLVLMVRACYTVC